MDTLETVQLKALVKLRAAKRSKFAGGGGLNQVSSYEGGGAGYRS